MFSIWQNSLWLISFLIYLQTLKFRCIKDILVNEDFGVNFSMVNEMTESYFYTYTKMFTVVELLIQVSSRT